MNARGIEYEIIVPSRRRIENMPRILEMLPTCKICVDVREKAEYAEVVPNDRLILHDPTETLGQVRQWVLDNRKAPAIVQIDDDFRGVICMVGRRTRRINEPGAILQIIENAVTVAADLGLNLFSWSRNPDLRQFAPHDPFSLTGPASNAWGVIGRDYRVDRTLNLCESLDLTLQNLLRSRVVLYDRRFIFDCGGIWSGRGGLQGVRTSSGENAERDKMRARWGKYVSLDRKRKGGTTGMSIRVRRRSPVASVG